MLYLGVEGSGFDDLATTPSTWARDYEANLADIEKHTTGSPPTDRRSTCRTPASTDPSLAPPGCSTLYVLIPRHAPAPERTDWKKVGRSLSRGGGPAATAPAGD